LPDEEFDHGRFVEEEFGKPSLKPRGLNRWWWAVGTALVAILLLLVLRGFW
jgi:hypothetical protein